VQAGYKKMLHTDYHQAMLQKRQALTYDEYETFYSFLFPEDGSHCELPFNQTGFFRLKAIRDHKRIYEKLL
jgi:hydroxymethylglutaryl-CoA synthase